MGINSVNVYKIALNLSKEIDDWIKKQSYFWRDKEIDQLQRSSASVANNIAEGYAYKNYPKKYMFFLHIALGSSDETQSHLKILRNRDALTDHDFRGFIKKYKDLSIRILNLIRFIKKEENI